MDSATRVVLAGAVLGAGFALLRSTAFSSNKASRRGASPQVQRIAHAATGVRSCGIDIGGSSCKVAADCGDGSLLLVQWPTTALADAIMWVQDGGYTVAGITGGGCKKFRDQLRTAFGETRCVEEIESMASGLNLCRTSPQGSSLRAALATVTVDGLSFAAHTSAAWEPTSNGSPHVIAIIGTGTSIVKVDPEIERVNGTCYGGGTYWGLQRLLTGVNSFEQLEDLIQTGNQNNVDMLVGDIYGDATAELGLPADLLASSLAKVSDHNNGKADIACSVLCLTCWTIGQLAAVEAQKCNAVDVFFVGGFVKDAAKAYLAFATALGAGSGSRRAVFVDGVSEFLGALGAGMP